MLPTATASPKLWNELTIGGACSALGLQSYQG